MPYKDLTDEEYDKEQKEYYGIEDEIDCYLDL